MKSQYLKDLYYLFFGKISILSFYYHKIFSSSRFQNAYINVGCGEKYIEGMINLDGNIFCKKDIWLDATLGLPFSENSIQGIYASHMIEHFNIRNVKKIFYGFYKVLKPGGAIRLVVPSLEYAINAYVRGNLAKLPEWPEKYNSIGGRFNNIMLCANQHFTMFDFTFLEELLKESGFSKICREEPNHSAYFTSDYLIFESDELIREHLLFVEAIK
jgi:predicted SAM-dependent methyltransferase